MCIFPHSIPEQGGVTEQLGQDQINSATIPLSILVKISNLVGRLLGALGPWDLSEMVSEMVSVKNGI